MSQTQQTPVVPLEAGAGPDNPPCPACGEPLFGWIDARPGLAGPVSRCESCGLGLVGEPGGAAEALRELDRIGAGEAVTIANRGGFSAWIGGAGWAGLERGARFLFTVEAVRRLIAQRDQVVRRARWSASAGIATMWQTVLNGFTFGRNVALGALGRAAAVPAEKPWQRRLDALISIVVAIPALLVAVPLELIAAALRRGGAMSLRFELL
jgi:antitoxin (DNA-binding transcriptional repressor) of toxin-antitoxin stability system